MVYEKLKKVLYIKFFKYIYGMLQLALLSYINMRRYFEIGGFKFNTYDPCVSNNIIEGDSLTVVFHVDDVK